MLRIQSGRAHWYQRSRSIWVSRLIWLASPFLVSKKFHFSIDLNVALSPCLTRNTMIHLLWWLLTKSLHHFSVNISFHDTHPNHCLSDTPRASEERISQQLVSREVLLLKFVDMSSTKLQSMFPTRRLFDENQISHRKFFECLYWLCLLKDVQIAVVLQVTSHTFEAANPFVNPCLAQNFFFEIPSNQCDSFYCCFPQTETKLDANTLFF